ncbi:MAG: sensor histidine kinase [Flavobacterium sp.]
MDIDFLNTKSSQDVLSFYSKIISEVPDLIFEFEIAKDNTFSFPLMSRSVDDFFELEITSFLDNDKLLLYDRIIEQDQKPFFDALLDSRRTRTPLEFEFRVHLPEKGLRWLKINAKTVVQENEAVAFYGRLSDITLWKEKENELRISEERFKFALEASTAGVWDWNLTTDEVFYSAQSMKIVHDTVQDVFDSATRWDKLVHPADLEQYFFDIQEHFKGHTPHYENQHRVRTNQGTYKWILDRGKVIERDQEGNPLRVIGTHTDISSQKNKELELQQAIELVKQQNDRLLNFSYIVSHNLNTQSGNIKAILDVIEGEEDRASSAEMLQYLRTVSNDLNETIKNLVQLVSIQSNTDIPIESLNLRQYIIKTLDLIGLSHDRTKVTVHNEVPAEVFVSFNPAYLESVLLNFTTNALKYADPKRPLVISYSFKLEHNQKVLSITDNGLGINLERHGKALFGLYKTFHQNSEARGLGLHITKNQIESMKGSVSVVSEVGVGTTFKIHFA